jgi:hypothetical protein
MPTPTSLAALPRLWTSTQELGLERHLSKPKRGVSTLTLALSWLTLAWRGTGRPFHLDHLVEPLLAALLGRARLPCGQTLVRSLAGARRASASRAPSASPPSRAWPATSSSTG